MISVLVDSASHSRGLRNTPSSSRTPPPASARSSRGTPTAVHTAAPTVRTATAQNAARQPRCSPISVDSGRPRSVPSISPFMATAIARPRASGRVSWAHTESATPKNACEATPVTTRATIIVP